ncbi:MAG: hypothetical protein ABWZ82_04935 [Candidatus Limnocylindrales bacterium]
MDTHAKTKSYPGLFRSQAEEAFRRDAVEAVAHGWQPTAQQWNGIELVVTYTYGPPAPVAPPPVESPISARAPARKDSPVPMIGAIVALVALGAITGLAVSGQGPFGAESRGGAPASVRSFIPPANVGGGGQADVETGTSCHDWGTRLDDQRRYAMAGELLSMLRREEGIEPATPPVEDVDLMMGIIDAMCSERGNEGASVGAIASLVWMSEVLED